MRCCDLVAPRVAIRVNIGPLSRDPQPPFLASVLLKRRKREGDIFVLDRTHLGEDKDGEEVNKVPQQSIARLLFATMAPLVKVPKKRKAPHNSTSTHGRTVAGLDFTILGANMTAM